MNELLFGIIIILGIVFHELGHFLYGWYVSRKIPKVNFVWYGITIGNRKWLNNLSLKDYILMLLSGIILGLPFFIFLGNIWIIAYYCLCSFDVCYLSSTFEVKKEYGLKWDTKLKDIPCEKCKLTKGGKDNEE